MRPGAAFRGTFVFGALASPPSIGSRLESAGTVALLLEGIAVHAVAVFFPEAGDILRHEFQAADPLHAFPSVEVRHYEADGIAMLGGKRLAIVFQRE